jgi:hypothetical protein
MVFEPKAHLRVVPAKATPPIPKAEILIKSRLVFIIFRLSTF